MKNDVGDNQSAVAMTGLIGGFITLILCVFALSIRSCNVAENANDSAKEAKVAVETVKVDIAKYQAMAECAKARPPMECEHLFEPKKEK